MAHHDSVGIPGRSAFSAQVREQNALLSSLLSEDDPPAAVRTPPVLAVEEVLPPFAEAPKRVRQVAESFTPIPAPMLTPKYEEITMTLDRWVFTFRTPYVCDNEYSFSFGLDENMVAIAPMFEATALVKYAGQEFQITFAGGNLKLPGLPFTILSFLKLGQKQE